MEQPHDNADAGTKMTRFAVIAIAAVAAWQLLPMLGAAKSGPDPKAVITGPEHATVGSFVELRGDASVGGTAYEWEVDPKLPGVIQYELIADGKNIRPATIPGTYTYRLSVWNASKISTAFHTLTVPALDTPKPADPAPPPTPLPKPAPTPVDPVKPVDPPKPPEPKPEVLTGTAKAVYDFAVAVESPSRAEWCNKLAARCRAIAAKIAADQITLRAAAAAEIGASMGDLPPEWNQFRSKVGAYLHGLYTTGQLATVDAIGAVLVAGAEGFEAAAKVP